MFLERKEASFVGGVRQGSGDHSSSDKLMSRG